MESLNIEQLKEFRTLDDIEMILEPPSHSDLDLSPPEQPFPPTPPHKRRRVNSLNLPQHPASSNPPMAPKPPPLPAHEPLPDPPLYHKRANSIEEDATEKIQTSTESGSSHDHPGNPHKKPRRVSPQPQERGTKRLATAAGSPTAERPKAKRVKKNKSASNPRSKIAPKPIKAISKHKFQIGSAQQSPGSADAVPNFVTGPESLTEYAAQVAKADRLRLQGNAAYKMARYCHAIHVYSKAMAAYPRQALPGHPHHEGYCASLANRGSVHMACGDYPAAASDLRQSLESSHLPPLLTQQLKTTLTKRLFRLVRCHLALLSPQPACYALEHVYSPSSPLLIYPDEPLYKDLSILSTRAKFLSEAEQQLEEARVDERWWTVLDVVQKVEDESLNWGLDWKSRRRMPGLWSFWRGEAFARLGKPIEAEAAIYQAKRDFPARELGLIGALIAFAEGSLSRADAALDKLLQDDPRDMVAKEMLLLNQQIQSKLDAIQNLSAVEPLEASELCEELLPFLIGPIATTLRIKVRLMQCVELTEAIYQERAMGFHYCNQVVDLLDALLTKEIGFSIRAPNTCSPQHRLFVIRALFTRARATRGLMPAVSSMSYSTVFDLLLNVWPSGVVQQPDLYFEEIHAATGLKRPTPPANQDDADPKGYYQILGISTSASIEEVKKAFRVLSLTNHPDKGGETSKFQAINEANSILSDPERRKTYDRSGK